MTDFRADLHCHSTCSDGTDSPEALVQLAVDAGLSGLSITDHDTVAAYATAGPLAETLGLRLLPGCEFSTQHLGFSVHILAYAFDLHSPELLALCQRHKERRLERYQAICDKLASQGIRLGPDETVDEGVLGRPHIAKRLIDAGYAKDIKEAFSLYIGDGRRCFVPSQAFSVEETLDVIRAAGGLAVIAHPMLVSRRRVLRDLLKMDFNGIEGYYACFPPEQERPYQQQGLERGWLITGGSDYHGAVKPHIRLGASWVTQETFDRLWEHAQQHKGTQH